MPEYYDQQPYQNMYRQQPPFGRAHDQGTIEEIIHRRVNETLDRSPEPGTGDFREDGAGDRCYSPQGPGKVVN